MRSLQELNKKIKAELYENDEEVMDDNEEEMMDDEVMDDDVDENRNSKIRLETESKIRGVIRNLNFEVNFRDLADKINDEIDGVVLTRDKSHQIFNIIQEFVGF